jgi:hypothetical protein
MICYIPWGIGDLSENLRLVSLDNTPEYKEMEDTASGRVEYNHGTAGYSIRQRRKDSRHHFLSTIEQSTKKSWAIGTNRVRAQARDTYARHLCLSQRIR